MRTTLFIFYFFLLTYTCFSQVPTSGLVAEYLFSNGSYDDTNPNAQGPNNATAPSSVLNTTDRFGNPDHAKDLAGITTPSSGATYINLGNSTILKPQAATISMWVNVDQISYNGTGYAFNPFILATNTRSPGGYMEAYSFYVLMSNQQLLTLTTRPNPILQTLFYDGNVPFDSWHHYVMTYDDDTLKTYIDGALLQAKYKGYSSAGTFSSDNVYVGNSMNASNNRALDGAVDDIRIYNRVLSQAEVSNLYNEANPTTPPASAELLLGENSGYFQLVDDDLRLRFLQEYGVDQGGESIMYQIYSWDRQNLITGNFTLQDGYNNLNINMSSLSSNSYYTLEFKANKGEEYILKFKTKP